jgi:uncharacterized protein YidB (DUF937 family)
MGLLDGVLSALLAGGSATGGQPAGAQNQLAQVLGTLLQQQGGLAGLVQQLTRGGLGQQVQSWISTGANANVSGTDITQALGHANVAQIAQQLGLDHGQAGNVLAQVLPHLIDHLTPSGALPAGSAATQAVQPDLIGAALGALAGKLKL